MIDDLREIESSLEELSKELDIQISQYELDNNEFHNNLIELISKYPEYKELIHFIVSVNDRLVTTQILSRDVFYEAIKGIILQKRILIKMLHKEYEEKNKPKESKIAKILELLKANKMTLIAIAVSVSITLLMTGVFIKPVETLETIKAVKGITGK